LEDPEGMTTNRLSLLFTGHMVDLPNRPTPRFPPGLVSAARAEIASRVRHHAGTRKVETVKGFASLARGGDILFHEVCRSIGIDTVIVLPFPPEVFLKTSVEGLDSGDWPDRFRSLWEATASDARFNLGLAKSTEAYAACNNMLLQLSQAHGDVQMIALWDRRPDDGAGGTGHFVERAEKLSRRQPDIIDTKALLEREPRRPD
jgi:hypothetical protein